MPLTKSERTLQQAGEGRKTAPLRRDPSNTSSREHSRQRGPSAGEATGQHGEESGFGRTLSRSAAESLKMDVPNTLSALDVAAAMKRQTSQSTDDEKENAGPHQWPIKQEPILEQPDSRQSQNYDRDDDDTSMTFGENGWDDGPDHYDQHTAVFRGNLPSNLPILNSPSLQAEARKAAEARSKTYGMNRRAKPNHRQMQQEAYYPDSLGLTDDDYDSAEEDARLLANETPSRVTVPLSGRQVPPQTKSSRGRRVGFVDNDDQIRDNSSPIADGFGSAPPPQQAISQPSQPMAPTNSSLARHAQTREVIKQTAVADPPRPSAASHNAAAKVSSFDETHQEELRNPLQAGSATVAMKRAHDDIDYDLADLKTKTYSALDEVPFLTDPRAPALPAQVDGSGNPLQSLSARLSNLSNMRPEDQRNLFMSLADDENEETGYFFLTCFSSNLKQLMEKRLERRKIALRFEMEAHKRQRAIEVKQKDCEVELGELKTGGNKLVEGRSADRIGMTPRKPSRTLPPPHHL